MWAAVPRCFYCMVVCITCESLGPRSTSIAHIPSRSIRIVEAFLQPTPDLGRLMVFLQTCLNNFRIKLDLSCLVSL
jgi:hypothetical protein